MNDETSATEELRRLLDERGVEWKDVKPVGFLFAVFATRWALHDKRVATAVEFMDGSMVLRLDWLTPEQAVEATLGRGTCHNALDDGWGTFECSGCGTQWAVSPVYVGPDGTSDHDLVIPRHCPNCGREVVE